MGRNSLRVWRTGGAMLGAVAVLSFAGYSGQAPYRAILAAEDPMPPTTLPSRSDPAEDHFPGAALLYAAEGEAAPSSGGATGTTALPALPSHVGLEQLGDAGIRPAAPFTMSGASAQDRARALQCLTAAIYYEAGSESEAGQRGVAQVILNRARHPAFPATVCGVIYQGSERRSGCQFSYACDGAMARVPSRAGWARAMGVAGDMLAGRVEGSVGLATHYHTFAVTPAWNRRLVMTTAIGAHFFHRWSGYWGTPAAFSQRYAGGEPLPVPNARAPEPAAPPPSTVIARVVEAAAPPAVTTDSESPDARILDRWKDSGKPLR